MNGLWYYVFPGRAEARVLPFAVERELRFLIETYERNRGSVNPPPAAEEEAGDAHLPAGESDARLSLANDLAGADRTILTLKKRLTEPHELWWTDLAQAELCINTVVDGDAIGARLRSWRRRMREVIGETRYASYMTGASPPGAVRAVMEADLDQCIRATYYFYGAYGVAALSRSWVTASLLGYAALILATIGTVALVLTLPQSHAISGKLPFAEARAALEWMLASAAAGVVGSVANVQRRLEDPKVDVDPFYRYVQTAADRLGIALVSPLLGAIFGAVAYAFLRSKLIEGSVLPKFADSGAPLDGVAASLLLIYGFLAGFAEQLVPDALTRLASRTLGTANTFVHAPPAAKSMNAREPANSGQHNGAEPAASGRSLPLDRIAFVFKDRT